jgi:hypothetical protein
MANKERGRLNTKPKIDATISKPLLNSSNLRRAKRTKAASKPDPINATVLGSGARPRVETSWLFWVEKIAELGLRLFFATVIGCAFAVSITAKEHNTTIKIAASAFFRKEKILNSLINFAITDFLLSFFALDIFPKGQKSRKVPFGFP